MKAPIIFIHYNDSYYLKHVLRSAKMHNPEKEIILIGDKSNSKYIELGVKHYLFDKYLSTERVEEFNKVYQRVGGTVFERINSSKGGKDWTKFNFLKWFVLYSFLQEQNIADFWMFDSDTMLLSNLSALEARYQEVDYTVMNNNNQLQGYVRDREYIYAFQQLCIELFSDTGYLERIKTEKFAVNPWHGFTMMMVFKRLSDREKPRLKRLNKIIDSSYFDECVCHQDGKEVYEKSIGNRTLKKLYSDEIGVIYHYDLAQKKFIRVLGINLSWVPGYIFDIVFHQVKKKIKLERLHTDPISNTKSIIPVNLDEPLVYSVKNKIHTFKKRLSLMH